MKFFTWITACLILGTAICLTPALAGEHEDLERDMKAMNKPYKALLKQIKDTTKNADSIKLVNDLQSATVQAKTGLPETIERLPEADRAKALAEFRTMMLNLVRAELDLEEQLLANDNDKAAKTLETIKDLQKDGHKDFRPKDHDKHEEHGEHDEHGKTGEKEKD